MAVSWQPNNIRGVPHKKSKTAILTTITVSRDANTNENQIGCKTDFYYLSNLCINRRTRQRQTLDLGKVRKKKEGKKHGKYMPTKVWCLSQYQPEPTTSVNNTGIPCSLSGGQR